MQSIIVNESVMIISQDHDVPIATEFQWIKIAQNLRPWYIEMGKPQINHRLSEFKQAN